MNHAAHHDTTTLITGASSGIGKAAALELARRGHRLILVCRDEHKGRHAVEEILAATGSAKLELMLADLSSLEQVRRLAGQVQDAHPRLDVLINNAGVYLPHYHTSDDGFEATLATNVLAGFALANHLAGPLRQAARERGHARVVNVSSGLHRRAKVNWDDPLALHAYSGLSRYGETKLMQLQVTLALARRLEGTGISAHGLHPGVVRTNVYRYLPWYLRFMPYLFKSPAQGARTLVHVATLAPEALGNGRYWSARQVAQASPDALDTAQQERLWALCAQWTGTDWR